ncbi:site-2 protease family protein [Patescibacteria group bacterium]|nr:site-2 protease family protein [Patescibacteria group bacterium]MBU1890323.1 site-2 protease family protein [Patescibacteria group bacterium]
MLISLLFTNTPFFISWVVAIIIAITFHEFSHALASSVQGDKTAQYAGRLTLNPLAHLDPLGTLMLLFIGFGYGRPVPFNPFNLKNQRFGPAIVAIAGPASNLVMIFLFGFLLKLLIPYYDVDNLLIIFLVNLVQINVILFVFNLFPIPPLDGSKVLFAILPPAFENVRTFLEQYGPFVLLGLLFFGQGIFRVVFDFFLNLTYNILS